MALGDRLAEHLRNGGTLASFGLTLTAATDGSDALAALVQLAAAMAPPLPPVDPLTVSRCLAEAADLRAWLTTPEQAQLLRMATGTVRGWSSGHSPRPGFELVRCKNGAAVWWRVSNGLDCG